MLVRAKPVPTLTYLTAAFVLFSCTVGALIRADDVAGPQVLQPNRDLGHFQDADFSVAESAVIARSSGGRMAPKTSISALNRRDTPKWRCLWREGTPILREGSSGQAVLRRFPAD